VRQVTTCMTLSVLTALLAMALALPARAQQAITIKFNPPSGTKVVQTDAITVSKQTGKDKSSDSSEVMQRVEFKKIATGFEVTRTLLGPSGQTAPKAKPTTVLLDKNGNFTAIKDIDRIKKEMNAKLTDATRKKGLDEAYVQKLIDTQTAFEKKSWHEYAGKFAGKTVKIGQVWKETAASELIPGVSFTVRRTITFAGTVQKNGKNCIRIKYNTTADSASLKTAVAKYMTERDKLAKAQGKDPKTLPRTTGMSIKVESERIVDPATLLEYGETSTSTRTESTSIPGMGTVTTTAVQKKVTTYKYL
jgi:hypothetical protein